MGLAADIIIPHEAATAPRSRRRAKASCPVLGGATENRGTWGAHHRASRWLSVTECPYWGGAPRLCVTRIVGLAVSSRCFGPAVCCWPSCSPAASSSCSSSCLAILAHGPPLGRSRPRPTQAAALRLLLMPTPCVLPERSCPLDGGALPDPPDHKWRCGSSPQSLHASSGLPAYRTVGEYAD